MTMAQRIGTGRYPINPVQNKRISTMVPDAAKDIIWDFPPNWAAIPVRDTLPFIGQQPVKAATKLPSM